MIELVFIYTFSL